MTGEVWNDAPITPTEVWNDAPSSSGAPAAPLSPLETIAGGSTDLLNKLTLGAGDKFVGATAGAIDVAKPYVHNVLNNIFGDGGDQQDVPSWEDAGDARIDQVSGLVKGYDQQHKVSSALNNAAGFLMPLPNVTSTAEGVLPAIGNVAKTGALGAGLGGTAGLLSGTNEDAATRIANAERGAAFGGILGGTVQAALEGVQGGAGSAADDIFNRLIGNNTSGKAKVAGFLDADGNVVPQAVPGGSQVSKNDIAAQSLKDLGFADQISATDTPDSVANKLTLFKQAAGDSLFAPNGIVDTATAHEQNLLGSNSPWQNQQYMNQTNLDFTPAQDFVDSVGSVDSKLGSTQQRKLNDVMDAWNNSGQSFADLKAIQQKFGLVNKAGFATQAEKVTNQLNDKIYSSLAGSLQDKADMIGQMVGANSLGTSFANANKAYSAASTLQTPAFNAANKFGVGAAINDLLSARTLGGAVASHFVPGLAPVVAANRLGAILTDALPVQVMKVAGALDSGAAGASALQFGPRISQLLGAGQVDANPNNQSSQLRGFTMPSAVPQSGVSFNHPNVSPQALQLAQQLSSADIKQESDGKADAESKENAYMIAHHTGTAKGLMQLLDGTAHDTMSAMGLNPASWNPNNPVMNEAVGTNYLAQMLDKYGMNKELALTAYHSGPGKVDSLLKETGGSSLKDILPFLGPQGQAYARIVLGNYKKNSGNMA